MSKWKFGKVLSLALSAALAFTSAVPAHAMELDVNEGEDLLMMEETAEFAETVEDEEIANLTNVGDSHDIEYTYTLDGSGIPVTASVTNSSPATYLESDAAQTITLVEPTGYTDASYADADHVVFVGYTVTGFTPDEHLEFEIAANYATNIAVTGAFKTRYTVQFVKDGDVAETTGTYAPQRVYKNDSISAVANPTKEGYSFGGWYVVDAVDAAVSTGTPFAPTTDPITADTILKAKWNEAVTNHTVTYMLEGAYYDEETVPDGTAIPSLPSPTPSKTGSTFEGWYSDSSYSTRFNSGTLIEGDVTLYGRFSYAIKYFDTSDSTALTSDQMTSAGLTTATFPAFSKQVTIAKGTLSKTGMTFAGWCLSPDRETALPFDGTNYILDARNLNDTLNLYAKYTANQFDVAYNNGVSSSSIYPTVTEGTKPLVATYGKDLEIGIPTRTNYVFSDQAGDGFSIKRYDGSDYNDPITPTFVDKNGNDTTGFVAGKSTKMIIAGTDISDKIKVTYGWTLAEYPISYVLNGGTELATNRSDYTLADNANAGSFTLKDAYKKGYAFDGWYTTSNFQSGTKVAREVTTDTAYPVNPVDSKRYISTYNLTKNNNKGLTFYAKYVEVSGTKYYSLNYNLTGGAKNNGSNPDKIPNIYNGDDEAEITLYEPTRTGYDFKGWTLNKDLTGVIGDNHDTPKTWSIAIDKAVVESGKAAVYPVWELHKYSVVFQFDTSSASDPIQLAYGSKFSSLAEYKATGKTKEGYTFAGWYYINSKGQKVNVTDSTTVSDATVEDPDNNPDDVILYGIWEGEAQTIVYNSFYPTGAASQTTATVATKVGEIVELPDNSFTVPEGYKFLGWAESKTAALNTSPVKGTYNSTSTLGAGATYAPKGDKYKIEPHKTTDPDTNNKIFFYAVWAVNSYYVIFDVGEGVDPTADLASSAFAPLGTVSGTFEGKTLSGVGYKTELKVGDSFTLTGKEFTRTGYTLSGWTVTKDGKTSTIENGTIKSLATKAGDVVKLSANWTLDKYSVTLNANGGKFADADQQAVKDLKSYTIKSIGTAIGVPAPTKAGHRFLGWHKKADFSDTAFTGTIGNGGVLDTFALYAEYEPFAYTARFAIWDDTTNAYVDVDYALKYGETLKIADVVKKYNKELKRNGFKLTGFVANGGGLTNKEFKTDGTIKNLVTDVANNNAIIGFTAAYKGNTYKITYALGGGKMNKPVKTYKAGGTAVTPNEPTRAGYTFVGWKASVDTVVLSDDLKSITGGYGNVKLTALWEGIPVQVILVDSESGKEASIDAEYGKKINLASAAKDLQTQVGSASPAAKFYQKVGKKKVNFNLKNYYSTTKFGKEALTGTVKLYSVWGKGLASISYEGLAETDQQAYPTTYSKKSIGKFPTPKAKGQVFVGWSVDFDESTATEEGYIKTSAKLIKAIKKQTEAKDIILTAHFADVKYKVNVYPNAKGVVIRGTDTKVTDKTPFEYGEVAYGDPNATLEYGYLDTNGWSRTGYSFKYFATDKKGKKRIPEVSDGVYDISALTTKNKSTVKVYAIWTSGWESPVNISCAVLETIDGKETVIDKNNATYTAAAASAGILDTKLAKLDSWKKLDASTVVYGKATTLPKISIAGYKFVGWKTTATDYNDFKYDKNKKYVTSVTAKNYDTVNLIGVFTYDTYTVKYDPNGGYYYDESAKKADSSAFNYVDATDKKIKFDVNKAAAGTASYTALLADTRIVNVQKNGYVFTGNFAYDKEGKTLINAKYSPKAGSTVTIYPVWKAPNVVTVTSAQISTSSYRVTLNDSQADAHLKYEIQYSTTAGFRDDESVTKSEIVDSGATVARTITAITPNADHFTRVRTIMKNSDGTETKGTWSTVSQVKLAP